MEHLSIQGLEKMFDDLREKYPELKKYRLVYGKAKNTLGTCYWIKKFIRISKYHLEKSSKNAMVDTLLHEIAHAISYERDKNTGHNYKWKQVCKEIGAEPSRLASDYHIPQSYEYKYVAVCPNCGKKSYMNRKTRSKYSCGNCSGGRFNAKYEFKYEKNNEREVMKK